MPVYGAGDSIVSCGATATPATVSTLPSAGSSSQTKKRSRSSTSTDIAPTVTSSDPIVTSSTEASSTISRRRRTTSSETRKTKTSQDLASSTIARPTPKASGDLQCDQPRPEDAPSDFDMLTALTKDQQLENICATQFLVPGNPLRSNFNHASIWITVERESPDHQLKHCREAFDAIIQHCIVEQDMYGGVYSRGHETYTVTNHDYPANPLLPCADQGAPDCPAESPPPPPPPPPPETPPEPTQIRFNKDGSGICPSIGGGACKNAYGKYNDDWRYTSYTSYTADSAEYFWGAGGFNSGCTAQFLCDNDAAYAVGMTGRQIKNAYVHLSLHARLISLLVFCWEHSS